MPHDTPAHGDADHLTALGNSTIEDVAASIERGLADVSAGRTIDADVFLKKLRTRIDGAGSRHPVSHGPAEQ